MKNTTARRSNLHTVGSKYTESLPASTKLVEREVTTGSERMSICFVGPYTPIMCGIGDYTAFLTRKSPAGRWSVLSFDLERYGVPLTTNHEVTTDSVWYGIPDRYSFGVSVIRRGLNGLGAKKDPVLWFQHEFGIWRDSLQFVTMLKNLNIPKVVTFHTLHFQSSETPTGLCREQYNLLRILLPYVDAITVFSRGVYNAVTSAFPDYHDKVHVIKHGIHSYPEISRLSRQEAKKKFNDFLLYESGLDQATKELLHKQNIFLDPVTIVLGQTGFLSPAKGSELLYTARNRLQDLISHKRIVAVRIGKPRDESQRMYAEKLRREQKGRLNLLLEIWLPENILPLAQRAFDINFYWPNDCTQSGVLAHALGAGAVVAGRDLEGFGETLEEAGGLVDTGLNNLLLKMKNLILSPELKASTEEKALNYATRFSWENQARRHYELTEHILPAIPSWHRPGLSSTTNTLVPPVAGRVKLNV